MTVPQVLSSTPGDNAIDVTIDAPLQFVFNTTLTSSTVNKGTVFVFDSLTLELVNGSVTYDSDADTVIFFPYQALLEERAYTATIVGINSGNGTWVESSDGDPMEDSYTIEFRTLKERYVPLEEVADRDDIELVGPIRAVSATLPAALADAAGAAALTTLSISSSVPANLATQQDPCLETITITLNMPLVSAVADSFRLETYPVLGMDEYLGDTDSASNVWLNDTCVPTGLFDYTSTTGILEDITPPDFTNPTGTWSITGSDVVWTRGSDEPCFMYNQEIHVIMETEAVGASGGVTGTVSTESSIVFTTTYWPHFIDQRLIRVELGTLVSSLYDDTINRIIHKNSIDAWEQSAGNFDIDDPYPAVKRYTKWATILDVLDTITMSSGGLLGDEQKMLGDFQMRRGGGNLSTSLHPKYVKAQNEVKRWLRELRRYRGQGHAQAVVKGIDNASTRRELQDRTWDNWMWWTYEGQAYGWGHSSPPAANTIDERFYKLSRSRDHHGNSARPGTDGGGGVRSIFKCRDGSVKS